MCGTGCEPRLEEVFNEPIIRMLMARDAVSEQELWFLIENVRRARAPTTRDESGQERRLADPWHDIASRSPDR